MTYHKEKHELLRPMQHMVLQFLLHVWISELRHNKTILNEKIKLKVKNFSKKKKPVETFQAYVQASKPAENNNFAFFA